MFRPGRGWLHALHPWPKLLLLLWAVLAPFALPALAIPILLAIVLAAGLSARLGRAFVRSVMVGGLALGIPIVLLNGLILPGARDVLLPLGPLAVTREGLELGLTVTGRLVVALAAATAFVLSTRPDDLMEGLIERGVSPRLSFALLSAVQAIPRLARAATRVGDGGRTRGLPMGGSMRRRGRALREVAAAVAVGALLDVRDRTLALESRGFSNRGPRTAYRRPAWRGRDRVVTAIAAGLLLGLAIVVALRATGVVAG